MQGFSRLSYSHAAVLDTTDGFKIWDGSPLLPKYPGPDLTLPRYVPPEHEGSVSANKLAGKYAQERATT